MSYLKHEFQLSDEQIKNIVDSIKSKTSCIIKITLPIEPDSIGENLISLPLTKTDAKNVTANKSFDYSLSKQKIKLMNIREIDESKIPLDQRSKNGGFFPFLIPLLAGISAVAGVGTVASNIVKTVNEKKSNDAILKETERHNKEIEKELKGSAISLRPWKNGTSLDVKEFVNQSKLDDIGKRTFRSFLKNLNDRIEIKYDGEALSLRNYLDY
jgi:hypothetical protein